MSKKPITDQHKLVKFLGTYLKKIEPQVLVSERAVVIFDDFIQAYARVDDEHWGDRIAIWQSDLMDVFSGASPTLKSGSSIAMLASKILTDIIENNLVLTIDQLLCTLCKEAGAELMQVNIRERDVKIRTTEDGALLFDRRVKVVVRRQTSRQTLRTALWR